MPTKSSSKSGSRSNSRASSKGKASSQTSAAKSGGHRGSGKRELIAPRGDKRYVRRDGQGRIKESDDVGKSLAQDRRRAAKTRVKPGYGDRGDR